jgi:hypothetical protein
VKIDEAIKSMYKASDFHRDFAVHLAMNQVRPSNVDKIFKKDVLVACQSFGFARLLAGESYRSNYYEDAIRHYRNVLLDKYVVGRPFSLMADETSKNFRHVINIILTTFETSMLLCCIDFDVSKSLDAAAIVDVLTTALAGSSIPWSNCCSITRDGASYMASAVTKLRTTKLECNNLRDVVCISHGLALVVGGFVKENFMLAQGLLTQLRDYLNSHSHRHERVERIQKLMGAGFFADVNWGPTRPWASFVNACDRVVASKESLMTWLRAELMMEEKSSRLHLDEIQSSMDNPAVFVELKLITSALSVVNECIVLSQSEKEESSVILLGKLRSASGAIQHGVEQGAEMVQQLAKSACVEPKIPALTQQFKQGIEKSAAQWALRVHPFIRIVQFQTFLNPKLSSGHRFGLFELPAQIAFADWTYFVPLNDKEFFVIGSEWKTYRDMMQDEKELSKIVEMGTNFSCFKWWTDHRVKLPLMNRVAACVFTFMVSGAQVERSFKTLRKTLPKDHTRDVMNSDLLETEVFAACNRELLEGLIFQTK